MKSSNIVFSDDGTVDEVFHTLLRMGIKNELRDGEARHPTGAERTFDQIESELLEQLENLTAVINHVRRELKDSPFDNDLRKQLSKDRAILRLLTRKLILLRQTTFNF